MAKMMPDSEMDTSNNGEDHVRSDHMICHYCHVTCPVGGGYRMARRVTVRQRMKVKMARKKRKKTRVRRKKR